MTSEEPTLQEVFDWFAEAPAREAEEFPGDLPKQGIEAVVQSAANVPTIPKRAEVFRAHEDADDPTKEEVRENLESWFLDHLAALANLQREWDLDVVDAFQQHRVISEAMEESEDREDFIGRLEEADVDIGDETIEALRNPRGGAGIDTGDNVDRDDYDPEGVERGYY